MRKRHCAESAHLMAGIIGRTLLMIGCTPPDPVAVPEDDVEQRVSMIALGVADIGRARAFYDAVGWRASTASTADVVFYQVGPLVLGLRERHALSEDAGTTVSAGPSAVVLAHNVRSRSEVDAVMRRAAEAGGSTFRAAADTFWGGYAGTFTDPDGHVWEIAWNPHWPLGPDGSVTLPV